MLSILNKLTLQKELQTFVTNMCFGQKENTQQQQNKKSNIKPLQEPWIEPGTSCTQSGCVTFAPPSQLRVSIVVKLFNWLDAIG